MLHDCGLRLRQCRGGTESDNDEKQKSVHKANYCGGMKSVLGKIMQGHDAQQEASCPHIQIFMECNPDS